MSRTKRKDSLDNEPKRGNCAMAGEVYYQPPTAAELALAHRDGKPHHKPGKKAKRYLHKGRKARVKQAVVNALVTDPDAVPLPVEKRSDIWNYN